MKQQVSKKIVTGTVVTEDSIILKNKDGEIVIPMELWEEANQQKERMKDNNNYKESYKVKPIEQKSNIGSSILLTTGTSLGIFGLLFLIVGLFSVVVNY